MQWRKDGAVLQSRTAGYGTGLLIGYVEYSDEGMYTCEVINKAGRIDASYYVTLRVEGQYLLTDEFFTLFALKQIIFRKGTGN